MLSSLIVFLIIPIMAYKTSLVNVNSQAFPLENGITFNPITVTGIGTEFENVAKLKVSAVFLIVDETQFIFSSVFDLRFSSLKLVIISIRLIIELLELFVSFTFSSNLSSTFVIDSGDG